MTRTFAAAIVLAVLGFAGGAYAGQTGLIGTRQIKNHSIRLIDLHPSVIKALRGQTGPQGAAGAFDPKKVTVAVGTQVTVGAGKLQSASVACPDGAVATGGGVASGLGQVLVSTAVVPQGGTYPTSWAIVVFNGTLLPTKIQASAVCASP